MDQNRINRADNDRGRGRKWGVFVSSVLLIVVGCAAAAKAQPTVPSAGGQKPAQTALPPATPRATEVFPMTKFARERGFVRCAGALELAERNLLGSSDYSFRAYPPTQPRATAGRESMLFSAIVDARKRNPNDPAPRATLNITVVASQQVANACTTIYEQTTYHAATCDAVVAQMAPNGKQASTTSFGSVLIEVSDNLTLTLIPVGAAQCITVIKEAAFDVPIPTSSVAKR